MSTQQYRKRSERPSGLIFGACSDLHRRAKLRARRRLWNEERKLEFDLSNQPAIVQQAADDALQGFEPASSRALSPATRLRFAEHVVARLPALVAARRTAGAPGRLRVCGNGGIGFAGKYRVTGPGDRPGKYISDLFSLIRNALEKRAVRTPCSQRLLEIRGRLPRAEV